VPTCAAVFAKETSTYRIISWHYAYHCKWDMFRILHPVRNHLHDGDAPGRRARVRHASDGWCYRYGFSGRGGFASGHARASDLSHL
jgi:hypothetical protein